MKESYLNSQNSVERVVHKLEITAILPFKNHSIL